MFALMSKLVKSFSTSWGVGLFGILCSLVGLPGLAGDAQTWWKDWLPELFGQAGSMTDHLHWIMTLVGGALLGSHYTAVLFRDGQPYKRWLQAISRLIIKLDALAFGVFIEEYYIDRTENKPAPLRVKHRVRLGKSMLLQVWFWWGLDKFSDHEMYLHLRIRGATQYALRIVLTDSMGNPEIPIQGGAQVWFSQGGGTYFTRLDKSVFPAYRLHITPTNYSQGQVWPPPK